MNGRIARKLRKLSEFKPHSERHYKRINNANNFYIGNNGEPERCGGTWLEVDKEGNVVTKRAKYNYMKEIYYDRAI